MALVRCPNCGCSVSEHAASCPNCGTYLNTIVKSDTKVKLVKCWECGAKYDKSLGVCPVCGAPKKKKSKVKFIVLAILLIAGVFLYKAVSDELYYMNMQDAAYSMIQGAAITEEVCNQIVQVWANSISKRSDSTTDQFTKKDGVFYSSFDDALNSLYSDYSFKKQLQEIVDNQYATKELMKKLTNPPGKYQSAYVALMDLYNDYLDFTNLPLGALGSYNSFSEEFNSIDNSTVRKYERMQGYLN